MLLSRTKISKPCPFTLCAAARAIACSRPALRPATYGNLGGLRKRIACFPGEQARICSRGGDFFASCGCQCVLSRAAFGQAARVQSGAMAHSGAVQVAELSFHE